MQPIPERQTGGGRPGAARWRALAALLAGCLAALAFLLPEFEARAKKHGGAVATENRQVTELCMTQLQKGGNAVDAAVTAALAGGVASPSSSGIGGGGFAMVFMVGMKQPIVFDFRETAPRSVDAAAFESRPLPWQKRGKLVGVPGELKGLFMMHQRFGKLSWKQVVTPAERLAAGGFSVSRHLSAMLAFGAAKLRQDPGISGVFYPRGKPAAFGRRLTNPKLARTLERVANEGPSAVYAGSIAADLVSAANDAGGRLSEADLSSYRPVERAPIQVAYAGHQVFTMPPPSAGGLMLAQALKLFKPEELRRLGQDSGAYQHLLAEALRASIADRMRYLGDPAFENALDLGKLLADARMAQRRRSIALDRTHAIPRFGLEEHGTHHLVTADAQGNMVSLTTTVNRLFGAKITADASGVVLNDELDDFTAKDSVRPFGMTQSPNRARAGARPVSSMTPTIVLKDGQAVLGLGGSGGTAIATNVTQMLLSVLVFGLEPADALAKARFYVPTEGAFMLLEEGAKPELFEDLRWRGEIVDTMRFTSTAVQMVARVSGTLKAASDPRKHGSAKVD